MPTDGTLFLENVPKKKQYLLTALSLFFSMGAVVSAIIAIIIIPDNSCPEHLISEQNPLPPSLIKLAYTLGPRAGDGMPGSGNSTMSPTVPLCDVATQNRGWKYLLATLGIIVRLLVVITSKAAEKLVPDTCDVYPPHHFLQAIRVSSILGCSRT